MNNSINLFILIYFILISVSCNTPKFPSKISNSPAFSNDPCRKSEYLNAEGVHKNKINSLNDFLSRCADESNKYFKKAQAKIRILSNSNTFCTNDYFDVASWKDSVKAYREFQSKCNEPNHPLYIKAQNEIEELTLSKSVIKNDNTIIELDPCRRSEYLNADGVYKNKIESLNNFLNKCGEKNNKFYLLAKKKIHDLTIKNSPLNRKTKTFNKEVEKEVDEVITENNELSRAIVIPIGVLGDISQTRQMIIYNKFLDEVSNDYDLVSQEEYEKAEEEAFQQLDYNECTEDQCIVMIQDFLQVENVFKIQLVKEDNDVQVSLNFIDLDKKLVKTDFCEDCKTSELIEMINFLYKELKQKR